MQGSAGELVLALSKRQWFTLAEHLVLPLPEQTLAWHWLFELDNWFLLGAANLWRIPGIFALWFAVRCVAQTACDRAGVGEKGK